MKVSFHAAERFLQRVFVMKEYSRRDVYRARRLLEKDLQNVVVTGTKRFISLPSFENAVAIFNEGTLITIYPKQYVNDHFHDRHTHPKRSAA